MIKLTANNFDISQIAKSGQCFRLNPHPNKIDTWQLVADGDYLEIKQIPGNNKVEFSCSEKDFNDFWYYYFNLGFNYQEVIDEIDPSDIYLTAAAKAGSGIRILDQDSWEVMISFVISQNNNIPRIKRTIEMLCTRLGEKKISDNGTIYFTFPTPEKLSKIENLQDVGLGYRDKYIQKIAELVYSGKLSLHRLFGLADNEELRKQLKSLYGIGDKVANCIMLFGFGRIDCFPKDVWINRIIAEEYNGKFPIERYSEYAGIIQQYLFNYAMNKLDKE